MPLSPKAATINNHNEQIKDLIHKSTVIINQNERDRFASKKNLVSETLSLEQLKNTHKRLDSE